METFKDTRTPEQIRRDRWGALAVVVAFLVFIMIVVLATMFGEPATGTFNNWFFMP